MASPVDSKAVPPSPAPTSWRRRAFRWLVCGVGCYCGVILLLMALENHMVFCPTSAEENWLPPPFSPAEDVALKLPDGTPIHAWWCPCRDADGALLFCHGNGGNLSYWGQTVRELQQVVGQSVLIFDYPGYGRSGGRPSEKGCYAAADAAYDWLTQNRKLPGERIVLYGTSLGGGVAVELASRRPHRALVLEKTFTSLPDMAQELYPWLPARWLIRNRFDNLDKIGKCRRPVFLGHGTTDDLVPLAHGERLYAAANEPKQFFRMEACGHNDPLPREFLLALRDFLARTDN
jgi:uncharacterized protein